MFHVKQFAQRIVRAWRVLRTSDTEAADRAFAGQCHFRRTLADEYARGYLCGWRECFASCLEAVEEEIQAADDASVLRMSKMVIDGRASN